MFQKVRVCPFPKDSAEYSYSQLLTSYAFTFVNKQLKLIDKVKNFEEVEEGYVCQTSEGSRNVNLSDCSCAFRTSMLLPCRHMFALCKGLCKPLYNAELCNKRWTSDYYRSTQRLFCNSPSQPVIVMSSSKEHTHKLTQHEKFRKASIICSQVASVASVSSKIDFQRRMKLLNDLLDFWKNGTEVSLVEIENSKL